MEGWDAEVAVLVPGLDRWFDVRLIAGYFEFYGDNGGAVFSSADISGWKAGIEVRPVPAVVLSATWYEDEAFVDNNWMFGVRLEIPLGRPGSFTPRRRHLQERLVEPVHRQNASINVGVTTEQVGPTRVVQINNAAELASFVSNVSDGSSGGLIVLTSTGGGGADSGGTLNTSAGAGLTKTGEGALTLNGSNTLQGAHCILGGTLRWEECCLQHHHAGYCHAGVRWSYLRRWYSRRLHDPFDVHRPPDLSDLSGSPHSCCRRT